MPTLSRPTSPTQAARQTAQARARIAALRAELARLDDELCTGTLLRRMKVCGRPECRCARDPSARHGPYYEWGRLERGRLVHTQVSPAEAQRIDRAIANYRTLKRLLARWTRESVRAILAESYAETEP
jgi:hypothetical protein